MSNGKGAATAAPAAVMPKTEADAIAALDEVRRELDIAKQTGDVETLHEWRDRAAAVQHYQRMRDGGEQAADDAGEVKVRAEAALGALDREANPDGAGGRGKTASKVEGVSDAHPRDRAKWRKLGKLPDDELDKADRRRAPGRRRRRRPPTTSPPRPSTNRVSRGRANAPLPARRYGKTTRCSPGSRADWPPAGRLTN